MTTAFHRKPLISSHGDVGSARADAARESIRGSSQAPDSQKAAGRGRAPEQRKRPFSQRCGRSSDSTIPHFLRKLAGKIPAMCPARCSRTSSNSRSDTVHINVYPRGNTDAINHLHQIGEEAVDRLSTAAVAVVMQIKNCSKRQKAAHKAAAPRKCRCDGVTACSNAPPGGNG